MAQITKWYCDGCGKEVKIESDEERDAYIRDCTNRLADGKYEYYIIKPAKVVGVGTVDTGSCINLCKDCMENVMKNCNYIREIKGERI